MTPSSPARYPALHGPDFAARPEEAYRQLRAAGPVGWAEVAPDVFALVVTEHRAAVELLNNTEVFVKDARRWAALARGEVPEDSPVRGLMEYRPSLLYADDTPDDPRHSRLRTAMDDCLARISMHQLEESTRRGSLTLLAQFAGDGRADLMRDFADTVPLLVFADLLGCPKEVSGRLVTACQGVVNAGEDAGQAAQDLASCLVEIITLRQHQPDEDVTSWMLEHPAGLSVEEIVHQLVVIVGAGTIPTAAWIAHAMRLLLRDDDYAGNLTGGTLTVRRAMDKALWTRSPMANFSVHYAREGTWLRGSPIPPDVPIMISHHAANTDPSLSTELEYDNRSHLAFSAGPHRCPAPNQASVIAQTAIETALDRLWDMQLTVDDEEMTNRHGPFHSCPATMPVAFRPKVAANIAAAATALGGDV